MGVCFCLSGGGTRFVESVCKTRSLVSLLSIIPPSLPPKHKYSLPTTQKYEINVHGYVRL